MKIDILILNIDELVTVAGASEKPKILSELDELKIIYDGALAIADGKIVGYGGSEIVQRCYSHAKVDQIIDARGKTVMPGFVDPHTHLVFAGSRHQEFKEKIAGFTYSEIVRKGINAGISYTVSLTRKARLKELVQKGLKDLDKMLECGTTTVEIKSGYGLDSENELKILKAIKKLSRVHDMDIVSTFLAHDFPADCDKKNKIQRTEYVSSLKTLLTTVKEKKLAEYADVFCDRLAFDVDETREILTEAKRIGFKLKLHADQTSNFGGPELAAELNAVSADHLDYVYAQGIERMASAGIVGVLLPTVTFHLMEMIPNQEKNGAIFKPFLPFAVKEIIAGGVPIALATDYNPGSSPTLSMQMVMQCAARIYRMNPAQIINAVTINAAHAIGRGGEIGSLELGKKADVIICDCPSHENLIDSFGYNLVETVIKNGKIVK